MATLIPRKLFGDHDSHVNRTCPVPNESGPPIVPITGSITFQHLSLIIAGAMMGFACLLSFFLIIMHATHFSVPSEQKQIIRITFTIPVFAILSFLCIVAEDKAVYLNPLLDVYEASALASFFLLLLNYISRVEEQRETQLDEVGPSGSYNRTWFLVFQQPVVMFVVFIATEVTQAAKVYCETSNKVQFAHVWLSALETITSIVAILAVLRFYGKTKKMTSESRPLLKLLSFKLIIFSWTVQNTVFHYLKSSGHLHADNHLTFLDLSVGIQSIIVCAEMVIFSVLFQFAYPVSPYFLKHQAANQAGKRSSIRYSGGFLGIKALLAAANICDLLKAIFVAPGKLILGRLQDRTTMEPGGFQSSQQEEMNVPAYEYPLKR